MGTWPKIAVWLAGWCVLAVMVAGCGGGADRAERRAYERDVRSIMRSLDGPPDAAALERAGERLDALDAPADVRAAQRELEAGLAALADAVADAPDADEAAPAAELVATLAGERDSAAEHLDRAARLYRDAGYDVTP